jgi:outer membrane lipoprotein-sorting protein
MVRSEERMKGCLKFILVGLLLVGGAKPSAADFVRTVSLDFEREVIQKDKKEKLTGKIFYLSPLRTIVKIEGPIRQWIIYEKNEMTIYYPEDKAAFHMIFQYSVSLPFFLAFLRGLKEDFGLSEMGYSLLKYEKKNSRLISVWVPPKKAKNIFGEATLEYQEDKLVRQEIKDPQGNVSNISVYSNHVSFGTSSFPMEIRTTYASTSPGSTEVVKFKNAQFNADLPSEIVVFKIPPDVKVREVQW